MGPTPPIEVLPGVDLRVTAESRRFLAGAGGQEPAPLAANPALRKVSCVPRPRGSRSGWRPTAPSRPPMPPERWCSPLVAPSCGIRRRRRSRRPGTGPDVGREQAVRPRPGRQCGAGGTGPRGGDAGRSHLVGAVGDTGRHCWPGPTPSSRCTSTRRSAVPRTSGPRRTAVRRTRRTGTPGATTCGSVGSGARPTCGGPSCGSTG